MSVERERLHKLIDKVDQKELSLIIDYVTKLTDFNDIEADNSPLTDEEKEILMTSEKQIAKGEVIDWEDIKREYGL